MKGRLLLLSLFIAVTGIAANYDINPTIRGTWPNVIGRSGDDIAVSARIVYVARWREGFEVIDFTNLNEPRHVSYFPAEGAIHSIVASGQSLFVTDEYSGLVIYDITTPTHPVLKSSVPLNGPACNVAVAGGYAYVTARHAGLHIIDLTDLNNPKRVATIDTPGTAMEVAVEGNRAYVADDSSGLQVINISDPKAPILLEPLSTTAWTQHVKVSGNNVVVQNLSGLQVIPLFYIPPPFPPFPGPIFPPPPIIYAGQFRDIFLSNVYAYVIDGSDAMRIVTLPPNEQKIVGSYTRPDVLNGLAVAVENGVAFVSSMRGIHAVDIANPASPKELATFIRDAGILDAAIIDQKAVVLTSSLNILDLSDPFNPALIGSTPLPAGAARLSVSGDLACVSLGENGLALFDISNPRQPQKISSISLTGNVFAITLVGKRAYATGLEAGLQIIDFTNPAEPALLGSAPGPRITSFTEVSGDYAYVVADQDGVHIYNVSNPANISRVGAYTAITGLARMTALRGKYLYVATDGGLLILDVSNPAQPQLTFDNHELSGGISIFGDTAYVGGIGLRFTDISNPVSPQVKLTTQLLNGLVLGFSSNAVYLKNGNLQIAEFVANPQRMVRHPNLGDAYDVTAHGRYAYLAGRSPGMRIVDISRTAEPTIVGQQTEATEKIEIRGKTAYAVGTNGFRIVDVSKPATPVTLGSLPGSASDVALSGKYALVIFTTGDFGGELAIIDISEPENPLELRRRPVFGRSVVADSDYAYVTDYGVRIFDLKDPNNLPEIGRLGTVGSAVAPAIALRGNYVYLATFFSVYTVDVSDRTNPWTFGEALNVPTIPFKRISLSGDYAYVTDQIGGLHVIDISHPARPNRVGGNVHVNASGLFASSDTLYIAEGTNSLTVLDLFREDAGKLRLTALEPLDDGVARIRASAPAGQTARLEKLENGVWIPADSFTAENAPRDLRDTNSVNSVQIYRLAVP